MFRVIKQVAVIVAFLLLTIFSFVYYQDGVQEKTTEEETVFVNAVVKIVTGGAGILNSILSLTDAPSSKSTPLTQVDYIQEIDSASQFVDKLGELPQKDFKLFGPNDNYSEKSEFKAFLNDFIRNIPVIYLDTKIYSNAVKNFWSALQFNNSMGK